MGMVESGSGYRSTGAWGGLSTAALAALLTAAAAPGAYGQIELPGIVVTSPAPSAEPAPPAPPGEPPVPAGAALEEAFAPALVVPLQELAGTSGAGLADWLRHRPGITGSAFAPGANRPVLRGLDN
jgi:iron complex outermembrane receptor protein